MRLTDAQRRALQVIAAAKKTRTTDCTIGKRTDVLDHKCTVASLTAGSLRRLGLVELVSGRYASLANPYASVRLTPAGRYALARVSPCGACGQPPEICRNPSGTMCHHDRPDGTRCKGDGSGAEAY